MLKGLEQKVEDAQADAPEAAASDVIQQALETVREHFDMEVAYLSEIVGQTSVFRSVSAPGLEDMAHVGTEMPMEAVYCQHIIEGRLPKLIPDTAEVPFTATIPITSQLPIGAHMSIPVRRNDGSVYGMFCCLSRTPNPTLNDRDLMVMERFVDLASATVQSREDAVKEQQKRTGAIHSLLADKNFHTAYQPIVDLKTGAVAGYESLTRFQCGSDRTPDVWFSEAEELGLGRELELAAIRQALKALPCLGPEQYLSINASPLTALSSEFQSIVMQSDPSRILLEITEHSHVPDYPELLNTLQALVWAGLRIAVDDAGAGYSSFQHIVQLRPDVIKLDMGLTRGIDQDPILASLASALIRFAGETNSKVVAEGIETASEQRTLIELGASHGQGWHLGRPASAEACFEASAAFEIAC
ncbi:MAG: EAL domain-containing protein [Pseudomonadota bacterium]